MSAWLSLLSDFSFSSPALGGMWPSFNYSAGSVELLGYVGPGAGLSMMGSLLAVACVLLLALLGPLLYPIRLVHALLRRRRERSAGHACQQPSHALRPATAEAGASCGFRDRDVPNE